MRGQKFVSQPGLAIAILFPIKDIIYSFKAKGKIWMYLVAVENAILINW